MNYLKEMRREVDIKVAPGNVAFSGILMMSVE
jgi:hypothetical protein